MGQRQSWPFIHTQSGHLLTTILIEWFSLLTPMSLCTLYFRDWTYVKENLMSNLYLPNLLFLKPNSKSFRTQLFFKLSWLLWDTKTLKRKISFCRNFRETKLGPRFTWRSATGVYSITYIWLSKAFLFKSPIRSRWKFAWNPGTSCPIIEFNGL